MGTYDASAKAAEEACIEYLMTDQQLDHDAAARLLTRGIANNGFQDADPEFKALIAAYKDASAFRVQ